MTRVVVDKALREYLPDLSQPVEFCDENGQLLGRFLPHAPSVTGKWEPPPLSEEEIRRILSEPTYTTAEVLAYLDSLE